MTMFIDYCPLPAHVYRTDGRKWVAVMVVTLDGLTSIDRVEMGVYCYGGDTFVHYGWHEGRRALFIYEEP